MLWTKGGAGNKPICLAIAIPSTRMLQSRILSSYSLMMAWRRSLILWPHLRIRYKDGSDLISLYSPSLGPVSPRFLGYVHRDASVDTVSLSSPSCSTIFFSCVLQLTRLFRR